MRRRRSAAAALAVALVLLHSCAVPTQAGRLGVRDEGSSPAPESPLLGAIHFGEMESIDPFARSQKQEVEGTGGQAETAAEPGGQEEEGEKKETIAEMLGDVLDEEFKKEGEQKEGVGKQFNETVASSEGTQETVVIISSSKKKGNSTAAAAAAAAAAEEEGQKEGKEEQDTSAAASGSSGLSDLATAAHSWVVGGTGSLGGGVAMAGSAAAHAAAAAEEQGGGEGSAAAAEEADKAAAEEADKAAAEKAEKAEKKKELEEKIEAAAETDVDRIIDSKDNEYVLSKPSDETAGMNLDPHLVKDLTVLIAASALGGLVMSSLGQPAINGYFIAGSLVGPGGLKLIKEIVQMQSVAQLGVQLLLFTLGLEFSLTKLRAVRNVALLGGLLQTALFAMLAGLGAKLIGTGAAQGAFVGAMVAMSSTSIVVKVLADYRAQNTQQGQITIGTLIMQDCLVGLLFAFMPVLATAGGGAGFDLSLLVTVMARVAGKLAVLGVGALVVSRTVLPPTTRWLARRYGADSFQLAAIAFCLLCALASARQGVSAELGAFVAGVMLSATEQQETVLHHLEPVTQFFLALFISSTGLVLSPMFLLHHLPLLAVGATLVIISKTILISAVVSAFHYPAITALAVGLNLSQIGEFVFVLLSVANQQALLADNVYLLLMGITALTLLVTPLLLQFSNSFLLPKAARSYPNGPSAGDLEMAGGSPSKRRPSAGGGEPLKESPAPEPAPAGASPRSGSGELLLGSTLTYRNTEGSPSEVLLSQGVGSTGVQAARGKLGHRPPAHRMVRVLAHSAGGAEPSPGRAGSGGGGGELAGAGAMAGLLAAR
ncbi:hypothetical protein ABPG75_011147 [Micractinium tetrahymenae]